MDSDSNCIYSSSKMERKTGLEPATSTLGRLHSTTELLPQHVRVYNKQILSSIYNLFRFLLFYAFAQKLERTSSYDFFACLNPRNYLCILIVFLTGFNFSFFISVRCNFHVSKIVISKFFNCICPSRYPKFSPALFNNSRSSLENKNRFSSCSTRLLQ